jgi:outer membrane protein
VSLARRSNPTYLQTLEGRRRAGAALRSAYGDFLPQISSSLGGGYREGRQQIVNGVRFGATSDVVDSYYGFNASMTLSGNTFLAPGVQRANLRAAEADIAAGDQTLRNNVAQQYLTVLQRQATAELQDTLVATAQTQLDVARIRSEVGSATMLDVQRAEVALGQLRVQSLQARNQVEVEKLRLFQALGIPPEAGVRLTTEFTVQQPNLSLDQLIGFARQQNPTVNAFRARTRAADMGVRQARTQYLPSVTIQTGIGGSTSQILDDQRLFDSELRDKRSGCTSRNAIREAVGMPNDPAECEAIQLTPDEIGRIRTSNQMFPFDFTTDPWTVQARVSLPIFDGFTREQRLQEAEASRNEARYRERAQELQLVADVTSAYLTLTTAVQTVQLQEQNARTAREALRLAQERFRVGASNFVEVSQARDEFSRAEADRINAIYSFHQAYAALENAVGRPLR